MLQMTNMNKTPLGMSDKVSFLTAFQKGREHCFMFFFLVKNDNKSKWKK